MKLFVDLLNKGKMGDSNAIAIIIANFFISSILGLRSMSYEPVYTAKLSLKTYILSSTGMERIWSTDLISPLMSGCLILEGCLKMLTTKVLKTIEEWLKEYEQEASNEAKALAYQILGTSLYNLSSSDDEKGKDGQSKGIEYLKKCISTDEADLYVFYSLYDKLKESSLEEAIGYLKTAFALNYAKAVIEVASLYLEGTYVFDDVTEDTLLKKSIMSLNMSEGTMLTMSENACICTADLQKAMAMKRKPTKTLKQLQKEETKEQDRKSPAKT